MGGGPYPPPGGGGTPRTGGGSPTLKRSLPPSHFTATKMPGQCLEPQSRANKNPAPPKKNIDWCKVGGAPLCPPGVQSEGNTFLFQKSVFVYASYGNGGCGIEGAPLIGRLGARLCGHPWLESVHHQMGASALSVDRCKPPIEPARALERAEWRAPPPGASKGRSEPTAGHQSRFALRPQPEKKATKKNGPKRCSTSGPLKGGVTLSIR